ncbi:hypothetical protein BC826DRAFT_1024603, partial [Russula brevipes]
LCCMYYVVYGPVNVPWLNGFPTPKDMTEEDLHYVQDAFVAAMKRSTLTGFDLIEIHGAHGCLFHSFLSPHTHTRRDAYGGQSFENRTRFILRVAKAVCAAWGERPLLVRLSATE